MNKEYWINTKQLKLLETLARFGVVEYETMGVARFAAVGFRHKVKM